MATIESLKKRYLNATGGNSQDTTYHIFQITEDDRCPGQDLHLTPDDCLKEIYDHAHAHHLSRIKVRLDVFFFDVSQYRVIGYGWECRKGKLTSNDQIDWSFMWTLENGYGGGSQVKLHYPDQMPDLEIFRYLWTNAVRWCRSNGYASVKEHSDEVRKHFLTGSHPFDVGPDPVLILQDQYVAAGYDVGQVSEMDYETIGGMTLTKKQVEAMRMLHGGHLLGLS